MKCFKCGEEIDEKKHHFFKFTEILEGALIREDYAHKKCWDEVKSTIQAKNKAQEMLDGMHKYFTNLGVIKKEYVIP